MPSIDNTPPAAGRALWWLYFALLMVMFVLGAFGMALDSRLRSPFMLLSGVVDAVAIAGLWLHLRAVPRLMPVFWRLVLVLCAAKYALGAFLLVRNAVGHPQEADTAAWGAVVGVVLSLPLLWALWRYSVVVAEFRRSSA